MTDHTTTEPRSGLPRIGRASTTGLSVKSLGASEYQRRYRMLRGGRGVNGRPSATGLSTKVLSHAAYVMAWRALGWDKSRSPRKAGCKPALQA